MLFHRCLNIYCLYWFSLFVSLFLSRVCHRLFQLTRRPKAFPRLALNPAITDIDGFSYSDFTLEGYNPEATIKMKMAV